MSDAPQQIGQYRIDREIGRGGMGVVYLGHDSRLDRAVAIKALSEHVSQDAERLARFEREAKTLAQLDHPNLAGIYGVEVHEGQRYLVLEFVEGETLADALERGPMSVDDALDLCAQVAAGVASAHDAGVIHRDLKPANIKITPEGKAKVLDFGLAKSSEPTSSSSISEAPTLTTPHASPNSPTMPGAILGTAPYMSPEQARGRRLDKRSDVWSFGCVLYECLTGARLFVGETTTDTLGAILHKEIDFGLLPSETPTRVRELLGRTLERDKERRLRDLGDASLDLEAARSEIGALHIAGGGKSGLGWASALAMAAIAAIVAGAGVWKLVPTAQPIEQTAPNQQRFSLTRLTDRRGYESQSSISPDGSSIVYTAKDGDDYDIFSQRVGGFNATNLTPDSEGQDYAPAFSPDGQFIAFCSTRDGGGIFIMGATGESPRRLTDFGFHPAWSPDGKQLAFATENIVNPLSRNSTSEIWVVDATTGETTRIYEGDGVMPRWSPTGARIACWRNNQGGQRDLFTIAADGSDLVEVTNDAPTDWNPVWSPDGKWLYFSSDRGGSFAIWRFAIDEATGVTSGEPERITTSTGSAAVWLSFSGDGKRLVFSSLHLSNSLYRVDLDPDTGKLTGEPRVISPFTTNVGQASISPDGRFVAYANTGERHEDLFIISSDGTGRRRLTNDAAKDRGPSWMGDGKRLVFYSDRGGKYQTWTIRTDGGGLELLTNSEIQFTVSLVSPDGRFLAGIDTEAAGTLLVRLDDEEIPEARPLPPHPDGLTRSIPLDWSSDSAKLLVMWRDADSGSASLTTLDIESGTYQSIKTSSSGFGGKFYSDSRYLLLNIGDELFKLDTDTGEEQLISTGVSATSFDRGFDLAPDDSWICYSRIETEADIWMIEFEEE